MPQLNKDQVFRGARIDPQVMDEKTRSFRTVIATESPVLVAVGSWWDREIVREILLMSGVVLPENNQIPLIDCHNDNGEVADVIKGSIRDLQVSGTELIGTTIFATGAEEEYQLTREGHLTDVSAGYMTYANFTYRIKPGEVCIINNREFRNDFNDSYDLLVRTKWGIIEGSLVPIGADPASKFRSRFGRNKDEPTAEEFAKLVESRGEEFLVKINELINQNKRSIMPETNTAPETPATPVTGGENVNAQAQERERVSEIVAISNMFRISASEVQNAIDNGTSIKEFRANAMKNNPVPKPVESAEIGMSDSEVQEYNLCRAILAHADKDWSKAKREQELSQAIAAKIGKQARGFYVPIEVQKGKRAGVNLAGTPSDGGYIVPTNYQSGSFIELLRNKALAFQLGVGQLDGLVGNVLIPKQTGANTAAWIDEQGYATAGNSTFGQILMSPKTLMARTELSRLLLLQSDPSAQALVQDDLAKVMALGIDLAVFHGTGKDNQPLGIAGTTGVGSVTGTSFVYATAIDYETKVADANADTNSMFYVTNPTIYGTLKGRTIATNYPSFILGADGKMNGYEVKRTKQVASGHIIFGDFSQVLIGNWGVLDVIVDPYTSDGGNLKIKVFQSMDIAVRHPGAFSLSTSFS